MKALHDHVYQKNKKYAWILGEKEKKGGVGSEFPDSDIHFLDAAIQKCF